MNSPEEETLQTKPLMMKSEDGGGVATSALTSQLNSSKGGGSPLPASTNQFMNNAFGSDFSEVRVHTGSEAIQMNQGLNARAFTHGSDVYFNRGEYSPESSTGKRLLGHELTHVVQQKAILQRQESDSNQSDCPTFVSLSVKPNTPTIDKYRNKCRLGIGGCPTQRGTCGTTNTGAVMTGTIQTEQDCSGTLAFLQNITATERRRTLNDRKEECMIANSPHRDGGPPWKGCQLEISGSGTHTITSDDCPNIRLRDNMIIASANDSFRTFLMWKPKGSERWSPIGNTTWGWRAKAVNSSINQTNICTPDWSLIYQRTTSGNGTASNLSPGRIPSKNNFKWESCP